MNVRVDLMEDDCVDDEVKFSLYARVYIFSGCIFKVINSF
jgi:hypothetical protein